MPAAVAVVCFVRGALIVVAFAVLLLRTSPIVAVLRRAPFATLFAVGAGACLSLPSTLSVSPSRLALCLRLLSCGGYVTVALPPSPTV
jgi:hypothetical protein